ncbi:sarcosine oxidase subunit gamma [Actinopolyspora xinjiangensis]|uniref:Sarcosine oxidase subunit gamma n=1 Tax=Actinopolyspora xinjiangensis TaxID=405564 RepID=A0A1H0SJF7_9ACTN|nr:sarcosine oxidase subunit gamma family protein [Actinopolyspora xinjiangensis]SDP41884.1 sarcosine oxidase subunit gamma [Actinopolyspora xinjiangensis]
MTVLNKVESETAAPETATAARHSPLEHRAAELERRSTSGARGVRLHEEPFLSQINLRTPPGGVESSAVSDSLGLPLPTVNRVSGDEHHAVLWLGPDESLIVAPDGRAEHLLRTVRDAQRGGSGSAVDVSANRTTLRLSGPAAREVLEKLCSLDLHPRSFGPGDCAQTLLGRVIVVLWQLDREPGYRIMVRCSFADYLVDLLLDAMAEFLDG